MKNLRIRLDYDYFLNEIRDYDYDYDNSLFVIDYNRLRLLEVWCRQDLGKADGATLIFFSKFFNRLLFYRIIQQFTHNVFHVNIRAMM